MVFGPRGTLASHLEALQTLCLALNVCYALRILAMPLMRILLLARALQLSALRTFALLCQPGRCVDPLVSTSCWALNMRYALRILAMPLMRILVLAHALQLSALRTFALLCQPGRCVDPLVSTSCWARGRCLVFSWGVVGPTSTLFAGPPPFPSTLLGGGFG